MDWWKFYYLPGSCVELASGVLKDSIESFIDPSFRGFFSGGTAMGDSFSDSEELESFGLGFGDGLGDCFDFDRVFGIIRTFDDFEKFVSSDEADEVDSFRCRVFEASAWDLLKSE